MGGKTIGHEFLELEREVGATDEHVSEFEEIVDEACVQVERKKTRRGKLEAIDRALLRRWDRAGDDKSLPKSLLWLGISLKKQNCLTSSVTYLSVGERTGLPLYAVRGPNHVFVRWVDGPYYNWETTAGNRLYDAEMVAELKIHPVPIERGAYMRSLSREETLGLAFAHRAAAHESKGNLSAALQDITHAVSLSPTYVEAIAGCAHMKLKLNDAAGAIVDCSNALALDPKSVLALRCRADGFQDMGQFSTALMDYDAALAYDPKNIIVLGNRRLLKSRMGDLSGALADANEGLRLEQNADNYIGRGLVYRRMGLEELAEADLNVAKQLDPTKVRTVRIY